MDRLAECTEVCLAKSGFPVVGDKVDESLLCITGGMVTTHDLSTQGLGDFVVQYHVDPKLTVLEVLNSVRWRIVLWVDHVGEALSTCHSDKRIVPLDELREVCQRGVE